MLHVYFCSNRYILLLYVQSIPILVKSENPVSRKIVKRIYCFIYPIFIQSYLQKNSDGGRSFLSKHYFCDRFLVLYLPWNYSNHVNTPCNYENRTAAWLAIHNIFFWVNKQHRASKTIFCIYFERGIRGTSSNEFSLHQ